MRICDRPKQPPSLLDSLWKYLVKQKHSLTFEPGAGYLITSVVLQQGSAYGFNYQRGKPWALRKGALTMAPEQRVPFLVAWGAADWILSSVKSA